MTDSRVGIGRIGWHEQLVTLEFSFRQKLKLLLHTPKCILQAFTILWKNSEGWLNTNRIHFYHQQADGTRLEIKHRWTTSFKDTPENRAEKKLTIFGGTTGGFSRTNNSCPKIHRSFYIGIKQDVLNGTNHFRMAQAVQNKTIECQLNPWFYSEPAPILSTVDQMTRTDLLRMSAVGQIARTKFDLSSMRGKVKTLWIRPQFGKLPAIKFVLIKLGDYSLHNISVVTQTKTKGAN